MSLRRAHPAFLLPLLLMLACGASGEDVRRDPSPPSPASFDFREVTTGQFHSCAISAEGDVACWGGNEVGQLGDGTTETRTVPVWVRGIDFAIDVDAGAWQTCAIVEGGGASCWGGGRPGTVLTVPNRLGGVPGGVIRSIAVGQTACALDLPGRAFCWGRGTVGEAAAQATPIQSSRRAQYIDVGIDRGCLLLGPDLAECFLVRASADGAEQDYTFPTIELQPSIHDIRHVTVSGEHACFTGHGKIFCWGDNAHGQLGTGGREPADQPVEVDVGEAIMDASAGWRHSCAVTTSGAVLCWGDNTWGQLGTGGNASSDRPVAVVGLEEPAIRVAAGMGHTCVVTMGRDVYCWGLNRQGQLGLGNRENRLVPSRVMTDRLGAPRAR